MLQSVRFLKNMGWNLENSMYWIHKHFLYPLKVHENDTYVKYRIETPDASKKYVTRAQDEGVQLILMY